ncbi:MAG: TlpA family protein disulfide reductase [Planctomycetes bacterium]|nr:TlpA family protein disulfide reductase [Planctomycetota bacterium]
MNHPLTRRAVLQPVAIIISAVMLFGLTSCSSSVAPKVARADESGNVETDPDYIVPEGTNAEILAFVETLKKRQPKINSQAEYVEFIIKSNRALVTAGDRILKQDPDEPTAAKGATIKLTALTILAANNVEGAGKQALELAAEFKADKREGVAKVGEELWTPIRIINSPSGTEAERKALADELVAELDKSKFSAKAYGAISHFTQILSENGKGNEAADLYDRLEVLARDSEPKFQPNADRFAAIARRLRLPGNLLSLEGKALTGKFDWDSYRGKVVLVDFWATWCGPCIGELPNVKANYEKYHDKGFDVVGISLDKSRASLEVFVKSEEIPWMQLFDEDVQKGKGWNHPMAVHYGVNAVPLAILVDKEGKVVSMNARGEELTKLLEKLLGDAK